MGMDPYSTAAGIVMGLGGTFLAGNAASKRKKQLNQLSEMPGVDVSAATGEAITGRKANFQGAAEIAAQQNAFDQMEMDKMLEASIPGYRAMQTSRTAGAQSFLNGDIPDDVRSQVYRRGASRAVGGGFGGSGAHGNLVARDLGLTSLDLMDRGQKYSSSIIGSTPMARLSSTRELSGVDPGDVLGLRSKERSEKIKMKNAFIEGKGATDVWSDYLVQQGAALQGMGMGGGSMGMGMGG